MKNRSKAIKFFLAILLACIGVLLFDRHIHISKIGEYQKKDYLSVKPVWFTYFQKEDWLNFEEFDMNLWEINMVVEDYNSLTKTWNNELAYTGYWSFTDEHGEPFILSVQQTTTDFPVEMLYTPVQMTTESIDGLIVSYFTPNPEDEYRNIVIEFKDKKQVVKVMFLNENLKRVYPVLEKIWNSFTQ